MTPDPTPPLTPEELQEMKQRVQGWTESGYILPWNIPDEEYRRLRDAVLEKWARDIASHAIRDLPRCIAEIERLSGYPVDG